MVRTPAGHRPDNRNELFTSWRQVVFKAWRIVLIGLTLHKTMLLQGFQAVGKNVGRYAFLAILKLLVAMAAENTHVPNQ